MPLHPDLTDISCRIVLTLLAGILIGLDRSEHGKPAGIRTVMLVCLAASFAMILANLLIDTTGKTSTSFVQLDMMRLPLGVLTGMGFIGAGTILRRGNLIVGITTAATLWFVTMLGFCFGSGHLLLGSIALALGLIILWAVQYLENRVRQVHRATVFLVINSATPPDSEIRAMLSESNFKIDSWSVAYSQQREQRKILSVVKWHALPTDTQVPGFVDKLRNLPGVEKLRWVPVAMN